MAVVPSLAAMAALTLFRNPHMQPEGYSVDYSAYSAPATVIQRRQRRRIGAVNRITAVIRGFLTRVNMYLGRMSEQQVTTNITATWHREPLRLAGTRLLGHMRGPNGEALGLGALNTLLAGPRAHLRRRINISLTRSRYFGSPLL